MSVLFNLKSILSHSESVDNRGLSYVAKYPESRSVVIAIKNITCSLCMICLAIPPICSKSSTHLLSVFFRYSQGIDRIWLDDVRCNSTSIILANCSHRGFGNENCVHGEDVAISCSLSKDKLELITACPTSNNMFCYYLI